MARRLIPDSVKRLKGTRPSGAVLIFPESLPDPERPDWLRGRAAEIWDRTLKTLGGLGIDVGGCGPALAQLCALQGHVIELWRSGRTPPTAGQLRELRRCFGDFHLTPRARRQRGLKVVNRFAKHGKVPFY